MSSSRPFERFQDIIDNIDAIERYTRGMDLEAFSQSDLVRDAVERCLARISEAASKLDDDAETLAPGPPWRQIRDYGNHLRHAYDRVEAEDVFNILQQDLAPLKAACVNGQSILTGPDERD